MIGDKDVLFYPGSYRRPYQIEDTDNANVLLSLNSSFKKPRNIVPILKRYLKSSCRDLKNTLKVSVEDKISIDFINDFI
jgi:transcription-repair coupling factor (superfamily II helicase)